VFHNARHAGVWAAKGDILIFTDDDATFAQGWLRAYADAFDTHPEMVAAGGPVRPVWEDPAPTWLLQFMGDAKTFGTLSLMEPYDTFVWFTMAYFLVSIWPSGGTCYSNWVVSIPNPLAIFG
jgi:glycosyl transferase family 2